MYVRCLLRQVIINGTTETNPTRILTLTVGTLDVGECALSEALVFTPTSTTPLPISATVVLDGRTESDYTNNDLVGVLNEVSG
jgi:hypothetical protein